MIIIGVDFNYLLRQLLYIKREFIQISGPYRPCSKNYITGIKCDVGVMSIAGQDLVKCIPICLHKCVTFLTQDQCSS